MKANKWRLIISENELVIICNGKKNVYKNLHAFRTALTVWVMLNLWERKNESA